ncbi:mammalian cell entry protein [Mycolicibacter nonchromogenicus]|uniref:Mammalian cell entry protein n=1 Tax=Mycolicibacter nonchromogenicus TaxID=1782 RepID=A0A1X1Z3T8_MYCNO|nr:MlaD family protein [Mycolicibacter nonchromogenicus]ORW18027.1 mammalian cell entry protein [Mycolicibacter nonchromogenicus]
MLRRPRRPIEAYNPVWVGTVSVAVMAVVVLALVGIGKLSVGRTTYQAQFAQAAQLRPGDQVTVAGIEVGTVKDVALAGNHVTVKFTASKGIRLGGASHAAIKLTTLLGRRYLELSPAGPGELTSRTIPLANTSVPYNLQATLADATTTFEQVDADRIAQSMAELSSGLEGVPEALPEALRNVKSLADVIAARRDQMGSLLRNVDTITAVIRDQKADLGALVIQGADLLQTINARQASLHRLLDGVTALVDTLKTLFNDEPAINALLANMREFAQMAATHDELVRNTLQVMPVAFRNLANASGSGTALDINLPAGVLIDSWMCALSARGKQFGLAQYFTDCQPAADPFPGWPPPDPARLPG